MKADYTHITLILDRSGSMNDIRSDVIGGLNRFIEDQKKVPGQCTLTLVQFDTESPYEVLRDCAPISDVKPVGDEYIPRGGTPLYDAMGKGIAKTGEKLASMTDTDRPAKVLFVVLTDGLENASVEYTKERIAAMTKDQTEKYKWEFVYLGANQNAMAEGGKIGVSHSNSANYSTRNTRATINTVSLKAASYRTGEAKDMSFSAQEREELTK